MEFEIDLAPVIPLRLRDGRVPAEEPAEMDTVAITRSFGGGCARHQAIVSREERRVWCTVCNRDLDPIQVIAEMAAQADQWRYAIAERARISGEVEALKTERKKLRDAVREGRKRAGGAP